MLLSELAQKECILTETGEKFGLLGETEMMFHPHSGEIIGFLLPARANRKNKKKNVSFQYIAWTDIQLIGEERILFSCLREATIEMMKE